MWSGPQRQPWPAWPSASGSPRWSTTPGVCPRSCPTEPSAEPVLSAVAAGQAEGDVEPAVRDGAGVHASVVDGGDGRHQGEAETETIVAGAVVEPGERQEKPVDLVRGHNLAGVDDSQQGRAVAGGGRDGDGAARGVVSLGVVEQVGH